MKEGGVHGEPFWRRGGRYVRRSSDTCVYIVWNCENPFLADPSVRGAMKSAMNIERIIQTVTGNLADPCAGLFAPYLSGDRPAIQPPGHHPAEAGQRLDEAGWHPGEEGVRWKELAAGGREAARFDLLVPKDSEALCRAADIISDELGRIGVSAEVRRLDKNRLDQHLDRGEFGAYLTGTRVPIDPGDWRPYFTSTGDRNHGKYFNRQVDALFDQAAEFGGWRQKTDTYRQIQEILQQDQPVTYLYWKPAMYAMSRRLRQVAVSPRGPFLHYPGVLNWWVAKESPAASGPASRGAGSNSP
jgi:peptide/nickel transport system substrate-binding protein